MYKSACVYTPTHKHTDLLGAITSYRLNKCAREGWREIEERMNEKEKHILDGQRQKKKNTKIIQLLGKLYSAHENDKGKFQFCDLIWKKALNL